MERGFIGVDLGAAHPAGMMYIAFIMNGKSDTNILYLRRYPDNGKFGPLKPTSYPLQMIEH